MKGKLFKTIFMSFAATFAANAQNFQQRIADIDEKAVELQRRLHDNELRLQRHAEIMEQAQLRLKALQAGQALPPKSRFLQPPPNQLKVSKIHRFSHRLLLPQRNLLPINFLFLLKLEREDHPESLLTLNSEAQEEIITFKFLVVI